jgi:hypothetical protein
MNSLIIGKVCSVLNESSEEDDLVDQSIFDNKAEIEDDGKIESMVYCLI